MKGSGEGEVRPFLGKTTSNPFQKVLDISPECFSAEIVLLLNCNSLCIFASLQ